MSDSDNSDGQDDRVFMELAGESDDTDSDDDIVAMISRQGVVTRLMSRRMVALQAARESRRALRRLLNRPGTTTRSVSRRINELRLASVGALSVFSRNDRVPRLVRSIARRRVLARNRARRRALPRRAPVPDEVIGNIGMDDLDVPMPVPVEDDEFTSEEEEELPVVPDSVRIMRLFHSFTMAQRRRFVLLAARDGQQFNHSIDMSFEGVTTRAQLSSRAMEIEFQVRELFRFLEEIRDAGVMEHVGGLLRTSLPGNRRERYRRLDDSIGITIRDALIGIMQNIQQLTGVEGAIQRAIANMSLNSRTGVLRFVRNQLLNTFDVDEELVDDEVTGSDAEVILTSLMALSSQRPSQSSLVVQLTLVRIDGRNNVGAFFPYVTTQRLDELTVYLNRLGIGTYTQAVQLEAFEEGASDLRHPYMEHCLAKAIRQSDCLTNAEYTTFVGRLDTDTVPVAKLPVIIGAGWSIVLYAPDCPGNLHGIRHIRSKLYSKQGVVVNCNAWKRTNSVTGVTTCSECNRRYVHVGLLERHYFLNNIGGLGCTSFALQHLIAGEYNVLAEAGNRWRYLRRVNPYRYSRRRLVTSVVGLRMILQDKDVCLLPHPATNYILKTPAWTMPKLMTDGSVVNIHTWDCEPDVRPVRVPGVRANYEDAERKYKPPTSCMVVFFDFETILVVVPGDDDGSKKVVPYMVCADYATTQSEYVSHTYVGVGTCAGDFIRSIKDLNRDVVIVAHNMGFDLSFIHKYLGSLKLYMSGHMVKFGEGYMKDSNGTVRKIYVRDSLSVIPYPLRDFPSVFGMDSQRKEVINHAWYNSNVVDGDMFMRVDEVMQDDSLDSEDKLHFTEILTVSGDFIRQDAEPPSFSLLDWAEMYCVQDVKLLRIGYYKMMHWMKSSFNVSILNRCTLPMIAKYYWTYKQAYRGTYELCGATRRYIQKAVVGGRVMTRSNTKQHVEAGAPGIADLDATSLYPTAMLRLTYELGGVLLGIPVPLNDYELINFQEVSEHFDGYFVTIRITQVRKRLSFPLISTIVEGKRVFTNDCVNEVHIDKITLEDWVRFHQIVYVVTGGIKYVCGRGGELGSVTEQVFDKRKALKEAGDKSQTAYKLVMNSAYGATISAKPHTQRRYIVSSRRNGTARSQVLHHCRRKYNTISVVEKIDDDYYTIDDKVVRSHYTLPQVGAEILSMSKRHMNEVMCMADDLGIRIYYQDTDSMHLMHEDIPTLRARYSELYGRELEGNDLGQFNSDFPNDSHSVLFIALAKKVYVHLLVDNDGNRSVHIRMKGIPSKAVISHARECYPEEDECTSVCRLYRDLYRGNAHTFDLAKSKMVLRRRGAFNLYCIDEFTRTVKF